MSSRFGSIDRNARAPDAQLPQTESVAGCIASYKGKVVSASRLALCTLAAREKTQVLAIGSQAKLTRVAGQARSSRKGCHRPRLFPSHVRSAGGGRLQPVLAQPKPTLKRSKVWPNRSLNPRRATASVVSLVRGSRCIIAYQAYAARLRARG